MENGIQGTFVVEVYSGGLLEATTSVPTGDIATNNNMAIPPTQVSVPVPSLDGQDVSAINDLTVRIYVTGGNGKKVWWSYTEVTGLN